MGIDHDYSHNDEQPDIFLCCKFLIQYCFQNQQGIGKISAYLQDSIKSPAADHIGNDTGFNDQTG